MRILYVLVGLPGSGKSTWAKEHVSRNVRSVIISRDSFRFMVRGGAYTYEKALEREIRDAAHNMINPLMRAGWNVVVDETNLTRENRQGIFRAAGAACSAELPKYKRIAVVFPDRDPATCLNRRMQESRGVSRLRWDEIITEMAADWEEPTIDEGFEEIITIMPPNINK